MIDDEEVRLVMAETGLTEEEVLFILAHQYGPNRGDIKTDPPMTEEEWRRRGHGVLAEPVKRASQRPQRD